MSRCGCTSPCPACPGALYVDHLPIASLPLDIPLIAGTAVTRILLTRTITIPASVPLIGMDVIGTASFSLFGENTGAIVAFFINVDGNLLYSTVVGNNPTFGIMATNTTEVAALIAALNSLPPGNHTITLVVAATLISGSGTLRVNSATLRTQLTNSLNLTVTGP